jgi:hypothetical protein
LVRRRVIDAFGRDRPKLVLDAGPARVAQQQSCAELSHFEHSLHEAKVENNNDFGWPAKTTSRRSVLRIPILMSSSMVSNMVSLGSFDFETRSLMLIIVAGIIHSKTCPMCSGVSTKRVSWVGAWRASLTNSSPPAHHCKLFRKAAISLDGRLPADPIAVAQQDTEGS